MLMLLKQENGYKQYLAQQDQLVQWVLLDQLEL
jgi:hypothetical protein